MAKGLCSSYCSLWASVGFLSQACRIFRVWGERVCHVTAKALAIVSSRYSPGIITPLNNNETEKDGSACLISVNICHKN